PMPIRIDPPQLDADAHPRAGIRAVTEAQRVLLRAAGGRSNNDWNTSVERALPLDVDRDLVEVAAVVQSDLKLQQPVRIERLPGADRHQPLNEGLAQNLLLDPELT